MTRSIKEECSFQTVKECLLQFVEPVEIKEDFGGTTPMGLDSMVIHEKGGEVHVRTCPSGPRAVLRDGGWWCVHPVESNLWYATGWLNVPPRASREAKQVGEARNLREELRERQRQGQGQGLVLAR